MDDQGSLRHKDPLGDPVSSSGVGGDNGRLERGAGACDLSWSGDAEVGDPAAPADMLLSVERSHFGLSAFHRLECGFSSG